VVAAAPLVVGHVPLVDRALLVGRGLLAPVANLVVSENPSNGTTGFGGAPTVGPAGPCAAPVVRCQGVGLCPRTFGTVHLISSPSSPPWCPQAPGQTDALLRRICPQQPAPCAGDAGEAGEERQTSEALEEKHEKPPAERRSHRSSTSKYRSNRCCRRSARRSWPLCGATHNGRFRPPVGRVLRRRTIVRCEGPVSTHYGHSSPDC
jgi:hypothetical protein